MSGQIVRTASSGSDVIAARPEAWSTVRSARSFFVRMAASVVAKAARNSASACMRTFVLPFSRLIGQVKSLTKSMQVGWHLKRSSSGTALYRRQ